VINKEELQSAIIWFASRLFRGNLEKEYRCGRCPVCGHGAGKPSIDDVRKFAQYLASWGEKDKKRPTQAVRE